MQNEILDDKSEEFQSPQIYKQQNRSLGKAILSVIALLVGLFFGAGSMVIETSAKETLSHIAFVSIIVSLIWAIIGLFRVAQSYRIGEPKRKRRTVALLLNGAVIVFFAIVVVELIKMMG